MKYVIDCTPEQLSVIKEILGKDANRAGTSFWSSPVCIALGEARPLSELCEEEAKTYQDIADKLRKEYCHNGCWDCRKNEDASDDHYKNVELASALRSFGSKQ